ncbi:unnamed protein product [Cylicostephanus goldi]|uniref:Uncharacterized protein n=1 Tax=Cylicostephanus goldi TaxID=71465 RepID=A0A3P6RIZ6_CYLGO|nr:unnamed protein product [Cylicostephanus goldi]
MKCRAQHHQVAGGLRKQQCTFENYDFATMDSEGYMFVNPHWTRSKNSSDVDCKIIFLEPARNNETNRWKDGIKESVEAEVLKNQRFLANGEAFYVRCYEKELMVYEQVYPGMRDLKKERYKVILLESFFLNQSID